ncbi:MAG: RNA 2',3'-cyclic phosphodiesterase [Candidatus Thorarchaeota archaeon]
MEEDIRVFLSIDIEDPNLLTRINHIQKQLDRQAAKMKLIEQENIHFTWRFFGDTPISKIEDIHQELLKLKFNPITIQILGVGAFPNIHKPRVIWVGATQNVDKLRELKKATDELLANLSYRIEQKKFIPHATIARVRTIRDRTQLTENLESLTNESVGIMTVSSIRMTKSTLTQSGPIYETLWEIPAQELYN